MVKLDNMIITVEGPSAAGKTTLCEKLAVDYVAEYQPTGVEPDGKELQVQAHYWNNVNTKRWDSARSLEHKSGLAVCDTDPMKLHYSWCLARIGVDSFERFEFEKDLAREAIVERRLGFADAVLVQYPSMDTLTSHKENDESRLRRSFAIHSRLIQPLQEWYTALEKADPGHVHGWNVAVETLSRRDRRYDAELLDELISWLPKIS